VITVMDAIPQNIRAALDRLIQIAKGGTGQSRKVANFLLAWWNAEACGGFDLTDSQGTSACSQRERPENRVGSLSAEPEFGALRILLIAPVKDTIVVFLLRAEQVVSALMRYTSNPRIPGFDTPESSTRWSIPLRLNECRTAGANLPLHSDRV